MRGIVALLVTSAAFGQTAVERTLQLQAQSAQDRQEIVTAARTISDLRVMELRPDGAVRMNGPEAQVDLAQWVLRELDQSGPGSAPSSIYEGPSDRYGENKTRIFYAPFTPNVGAFQEFVTLVRTISEVRRIFQYNARRAMVARGSEPQLVLIGQLFEEMARRAAVPRGHAVSDEYVLNDPQEMETHVRLLYAGYQETDQSFQEVVTVLRTISGARRAFLQRDLRAIALRGEADQIDLARWLFDQLDRPAGSSGSPERTVPGTQDVVRVIALGPQFTEDGARTLAARLGEAPALKSLKYMLHGNILTVRGTVAQVLEIDRLTRH